MIDWITTTLGELVEIQSGHTPSRFELGDQGRYPFVKVDDLNRSSRVQMDAREWANAHAGLVPVGAIIFSKRGAAIESNKVRVAGVPLMMDTNMMALVPNETKVSGDYLFYLIQQIQLFKIADTSSIPQINNKHIIPYAVRLPGSLAAQKAASATLAAVDDAIDACQALVAACQRRRTALLQQLLTGERRFPGFDKPWRKTRIGDVLTEVKRPVAWSDDDEYALLSARRASGGLFLRGRLRGQEILTKKMNVTRTGDFLISKMQVLHGGSALTTEEFDGMHISDSYVALRTRDEEALDIRFFALLAKTRKMYHLAYISSYGVHIEKMTFDLDDYLAQVIEIPPDTEEQRKIIAVFDSIDSELNLLARLQTAYRTQKRGLMQQLLTGKRRVHLPTI